MKELAKHIEVLLLENDCVIVPGLGGFIAHNKQAEFKESANIFCPPQRTIGFNPQLVMNDGLLVQSYMQAYNTDFPDATRKVETVVSLIKESLYQNGQAELDNIGTLYYTMNGLYGFEPTYSSFFTPQLYGLANFSLSPLCEIKKEETNNDLSRIIVHTAIEEETYETKNLPTGKSNIIHKILQNAVGIAAAIILFFILSVPVENTYLDNASYASLGAETMLDAIRSKSVAVSCPAEKQQNKVVRTKNNVNTLKPVAIKSVIVEKQEQKTEVKKTTTKEQKRTIQDKSEKNISKQTNKKCSYIIAASLPTMKDAEKELAKFKEQGYDDAEIVVHSDRYRISLYSFDNKGKAYDKAKELKKEEKFKNVWVFNKSK